MGILIVFEQQFQSRKLQPCAGRSGPFGQGKNGQFPYSFCFYIRHLRLAADQISNFKYS
jgi:hypothetical protein